MSTKNHAKKLKKLAVLGLAGAALITSEGLIAAESSANNAQIENYLAAGCGAAPSSALSSSRFPSRGSYPDQVADTGDFHPSRYESPEANHSYNYQQPGNPNQNFGQQVYSQPAQSHSCATQAAPSQAYNSPNQNQFSSQPYYQANRQQHMDQPESRDYYSGPSSSGYSSNNPQTTANDSTQPYSRSKSSSKSGQ